LFPCGHAGPDVAEEPACRAHRVPAPGRRLAHLGRHALVQEAGEPAHRHHSDRGTHGHPHEAAHQGRRPPRLVERAANACRTPNEKAATLISGPPSVAENRVLRAERFAVMSAAAEVTVSSRVSWVSAW